MLSENDWLAFSVTLKLASLSTFILIVLGTPFAWWLSRTRSKIKPLIEAIIALPIVLPPTVLGFYLLILLSSQGGVGQVLSRLGVESIAFTFTGLVIGSVLYSLPFVVQPLQTAFSSISRQSLETAATLRASPLDCFFSVVIPQARMGFFTAIVLGFAHTVGEFGVVLMIGGNIPGETQVLSIAIYEHVEALEYTQAHLLSGSLLIVSFVMLLLIYATNRRKSILL
ncbi:MAG: molybdate ABC transporter permease subunit [Methylococcales bacterium]|nr:molybdate ABC transporter permease subunit [Methylococcales bacterium]MBT7411191.1 molybdate ABC transporter permease subunit [Methylococcales bacterium]